MTVLKKAPHMLAFEVIVMFFSLWPQLDFLYKNNLLLLFRLLEAFTLLVLILTEIHDSANGRLFVRRDLDKIQTLLLGHLQGIRRRYNT